MAPLSVKATVAWNFTKRLDNDITERRIPGFLLDHNYVDMRPEADYQTDLEKIAGKIRQGLEVKDGLHSCRTMWVCTKEAEQGLRMSWGMTKTVVLNS